MRKITFLLMGFITATSFAQTFTEVTGAMTKNFYFSGSDVGDFDGDGDLDLIICGATDTSGNASPDTSICVLYENVNGNFQENTAYNLSYSIHLGDVKFIDINQDGLLDLTLTGLSYANIVDYQHYTYLNTGSGYQLLETLPGKIYGSVVVTDFDHNGLQDYVLNGTRYDNELQGFVNKAELYKNKPTGFERSLLVEGSSMGSIQIADFNNDMEMDVLIMGYDTDYAPFFKFYLNNGQGSLTEHLVFDGYSSGTMAVADFNA
ncbi:MAG: FG-GAP-like repeat-containing protein, partial [Mesonia hippocampi]|uniref:FG-GAP-like repeat-containing protein n=1 Tax=Mesonia hippocampi TaxID=1628250 RepID=UPI003F9C03E6